MIVRIDYISPLATELIRDEPRPPEFHKDFSRPLVIFVSMYTASDTSPTGHVRSWKGRKGFFMNDVVLRHPWNSYWLFSCRIVGVDQATPVVVSSSHTKHPELFASLDLTDDIKIDHRRPRHLEDMTM